MTSPGICVVRSADDERFFELGVSVHNAIRCDGRDAFRSYFFDRNAEEICDMVFASCFLLIGFVNAAQTGSFGRLLASLQ